MTADSSSRSSSPRRFGGWARNISRATWLAVAVLAVTVTSLVVTSLLNLSFGQSLAEGLIDGQLQRRASLKADEVARYLEGMQGRTAALATGQGTIEVSERFAEAHAELAALDSGVVAESSDLVDAFYRDQFAPALEASIGTTVAWRTLTPVDDAAVYLQSHYVVGSEEPRSVDDAGDGSVWSEVHREVHLGFLEIIERLGAADLYIVEPDSGIVVYSAAKAPDFATSLDVGPYGGSTLAAAVRAVREAPERGAVTVLDMAPHVPDLGAPMLFMASPIQDGARLIGILVLKIPGEPIDGIMTSEGNWVDEGFGDTGEAYLVALDGRTRSVSRSYVENPEAFLVDLDAAETVADTELNAIAGVGTTSVFLSVGDGRELAEAVTSGATLIERSNYLERPVLTAVAPVELEGLEWFSLAEVEVEEIEGPISDFREGMVIAMAVFVISITFATVAWVGGVFRPVRAIADKMRRIHEGEALEEGEPVGTAPREFTDLADSIDSMLDALHQREADLVQASVERLNTVRSLLPPAIAERVEAGDRNVIDQIPQAGILVLVFDRLGEMAHGQDVARTRELLDRLVEEIDSLALHHGAERVKLVGDAYFAGCGLTQPYLDHVPRSVAFALDARDAVRELATIYETNLEMAAGIHSGPVTLGLAGSTRLAYDLWGETVGAAHFLARLARPGEILVSETVRALLPPDIAVAQKETKPATPPVWEIIGQLTPEDSAS